MISREELRDAQERVTKLEKLLGSNTLVLDSKQEEVERETLYSRLNKISQLHKVIMDRDKNKPISEFLTLYSQTPEIFENFSKYARSLGSIIDESRYILSVSDQIKNFVSMVKKVKAECEAIEADKVEDLDEKMKRMEEINQKCEPLLVKNELCNEVMDKLLQQYNDYITVLNKRMVYLDHLITVKEKEKAKQGASPVPEEEAQPEA